MRKLAHILIAFSLILGQVFASENFESKLGLDGDSAEFSMTSLLVGDEACAQDNCACSEPDCTTGLMLDCVYAAGSAGCAPGVFGSLIANQSSMMSDLSGSLPIRYQAPIYHDVSLGVQPHPPKATS